MNRETVKALRLEDLELLSKWFWFGNWSLVRNFTCLFTSPFHQFTACLHPISLARLFKLVCSHYWWTIIADSFSYVAAFLSWFHWHCLSFWAQKMQLLSLSRGIQESLTLAFDPSLPPFLTFSLILKPPTKSHFLYCGPANRGQKAVLSSPPLQTRVSAKTERRKALTVSFPDLVCKAFQWNAFKLVK